VASCAACERGLVERAVERAQFVPEPRTLARLTPHRTSGASRWRRALLVAVPVAACAAGVLVVTSVRQPSEPAILRESVTKGGVEASVMVERKGVVSALGAVAHVQPDDRLQVTISLPEPRFVAVYSCDGAGSVSRYAPIDTAMVAMAPGAEQVLPNSTILDGVPGRETIAVFACVHEQSDAVLREHVLGGAPSGCDVSRTELLKASP
ncbi:MAG: hypothetical protein ABIY55_25765, partial [Kofleriaceae bacterium]